MRLHHLQGREFQGIQIVETAKAYRVDTGKLQLEIPKERRGYLASNLVRDGKQVANNVYPVFVWETRRENGYSRSVESREFCGEILSVELEEQGKLQAVFCFKGNHIPTEEVDTYHFGPLKGLGSRHNVRHWGCSCKEPRIAMAGHHRFLCYLTGDLRLLDIFEEVKDSDYTMIERQKVRNADNPDYRPGARSGPDWSTFTSNWMTWYELTLEEWYRERIETGIQDIMATPYGLASGPDYGYDVDSAHLIYQGEVEKTPNQHLLICMWAPQIWFELADMLEDDSLNLLIERLGPFITWIRKRRQELLREKSRIDHLIGRALRQQFLLSVR